MQATPNREEADHLYTFTFNTTATKTTNLYSLDQESDGNDNEYDLSDLNTHGDQMKSFAIHFNREELSDTLLSVNENLSFYVNKFLLASCSSVFKKMFYDPNWTDKRTTTSQQQHVMFKLVEAENSELVFEKYGLTFFYSKK